MGRKILFITSDQQRYDALGCNGGQIARTPVVDGWAREGIRYTRAYNQNTVCMPSRSTMLTGQHPRTHGVICNGIPLPVDAPSVAAHLAEKAGYRTALLGKAHFEPGFDPHLKYAENTRPERGDTGPWRGFDTSINAMHTAFEGGRPVSHYGKWVAEHHPEHLQSFSSMFSQDRGGDTGAPETKNNIIPTSAYHTDWVADEVVAYLDSLSDDEDWFVWMSFPDPHHPFDPPAEENHRVDWHELSLPPGHPGSPEKIHDILAKKPAHWLKWWEGTFRNTEGGAAAFRPQELTDDMHKEIHSKIHIMNELIDEACGRVMKNIEARGWGNDTDVFYTTDHGDLQSDFGLLLKGPFHTEALMHLPFVWRPAPNASIPSVEIDDPVGHVDLARTFCDIVGVEPAAWMEGQRIPTEAGTGRERILCEWDSQFPGYGMHLRSIYRDGWLCTAYEESTDGQPNGLEKLGEGLLKKCGVHYEGTEGELYNLVDDPYCWENLWDDAAHLSRRKDLVADLYDNLGPERAERLEVETPA